MTNKKTITEAAQQLADEIGLVNVTRSEVCKRAGIAECYFNALVGCSFDKFIDELVSNGKPSERITIRASSRKHRKEQILLAAIKIAEQKGYQNVMRADVAKAVGVSESLITRYFNTMDQLRRDIVRHAVKSRNLRVIAQAYVSNDRHVKKAPKELVQQAIASI